MHMCVIQTGLEVIFEVRRFRGSVDDAQLSGARSAVPLLVEMNRPGRRHSFAFWHLLKLRFAISDQSSFTFRCMLSFQIDVLPIDFAWFVKDAALSAG